MCGEKCTLDQGISEYGFTSTLFQILLTRWWYLKYDYLKPVTYCYRLKATLIPSSWSCQIANILHKFMSNVNKYQFKVHDMIHNHDNIIPQNLFKDTLISVPKVELSVPLCDSVCINVQCIHGWHWQSTCAHTGSLAIFLQIAW